MVASKILMVDDEPDLKPLVMSGMRRDIRAGRYEFIFAEDGVEAVGILSSDKDIDIIITDINMPRMDGLTLLNEISKINPDTVAIVVSAYGDMPNICTAMNRGAFDFVTKPINFQDFRVTISRTLSHLEEWRVAQSTKERLLAMEMELDLASRMQKSILPTAFPESRDYQNHARMEPAREVGGDFYDLIRLEDEKVGIVMADVSEKGSTCRSAHDVYQNNAQGHVNMCVNVIRRQPFPVSVQRRFRPCRRHPGRRPSSVPAPSASGTCSPPPAASSRSQLSPCPPS